MDHSQIRATAGALPGRLPGGLAIPGSPGRRLATIRRPTRVFFPGAPPRIAPPGLVLPVAKGGIGGQVSHLVVDGPFAGGHLIRHGSSYDVAAAPELRPGG